MKFWDVMATRYSHPDFLLDGYISCGQLRRFIHEAWSLYQEDYLWEFWLAKVNNGKSFNDFKDSLGRKPAPASSKKQRPPDEEIRAIIQASKKVVAGNYAFEDSR